MTCNHEKMKYDAQFLTSSNTSYQLLTSKAQTLVSFSQTSTDSSQTKTPKQPRKQRKTFSLLLKFTNSCATVAASCASRPDVSCFGSSRALALGSVWGPHMPTAGIAQQPERGSVGRVAAATRSSLSCKGRCLMSQMMNQELMKMKITCPLQDGSYWAKHLSLNHKGGYS